MVFDGFSLSFISHVSFSTNKSHFLVFCSIWNLVFLRFYFHFRLSFDSIVSVTQLEYFFSLFFLLLGFIVWFVFSVEEKSCRLSTYTAREFDINVYWHAVCLVWVALVMYSTHWLYIRELIRSMTNFFRSVICPSVVLPTTAILNY